MDKRIVYNIIYLSKHITLDIVEQWCNATCQYFSPIKMSGRIISKGKIRKYNKTKFYGELEKEINNGMLSLTLLDDINMLSISQSAVAPHITNFLLIIEEEKICFDLDNLLEQLMIHNGVVGFKCSSEDDFWQDADNLLHYTSMNKSLDGVKTKISTFGPKTEIVDTEYNPGHSHRVHGIWFGSCHKMWFGKEYFQYIDKYIFENFKNCYENRELYNDVIRITLYENLWDYDTIENRNIQWDFRKKTGIDDIAHLLSNIKAPQNSSDPVIEILTGNFINGGTKIAKYYFDHDNSSVTKSKAVKVKSYEISDKGKILFQDESFLS